MTHLSVLGVAIQLTLVSLICSSPDVPDGLGKPDQPLNAISGQVLSLDGSPAGFAKLRVQHSVTLAGIDATIPTDALGRFAFELRFAREALSQIRFTAESKDGTAIGLHRFPWEADELALKDISIKLQPVRTVRAVVVDEQSKPIENARVVFQLPYPHSIVAASSNQAGLYTARIPDSERVEVVAAWKDLCGFDYQIYRFNQHRQADLKAIQPEFPRDTPEQLMLDGVSPVTVSVVDDKGSPVAKASIHPWLLMKDGAADNLNFSFFSELVSQDTDIDGNTTFHWWPKWQKSETVFWPSLVGYERPRGNYKPEHHQGKLSITMNRLVPIRGTVLDAQGEPVEGITVQVQGAGRSFNNFFGSIKTGKDGRYEVLAEPNQIYLAVVNDKQWASSPQTGFAVLPTRPVEDRDFRLRKPTRVHGNLLNSATKEPIPDQQVIVYLYGTSLLDQGDLLIPNPDNERMSVQPIIQYYATSDSKGHFEFLLGDGNFDIRPPQQESNKMFVVSGEAEIEMDVLTKVHRKVELVGLVVDEDGQTPIEDAAVTGVPRSFSSMDWEAQTTSDGKFKVLRRPEHTFVHAISSDKKLATVTKVNDVQRAFVMEMSKVGEVVGRLVDAKKQPISGQRIEFGIKVPDLNEETWSNRFGGHIITDKNGEFKIQALVSKWEYELNLPPTNEDAIPRVCKFTVAPGEQLQLGDISQLDK